MSTMSSCAMKSLRTVKSLVQAPTWAQKAMSAVFPSCCKDDSAVPSPDRQRSMPLTAPSRPRVLHFGGTDFGRGFIMRVLADAGCKLVLADPSPSLVYPLSEEKKYKVRRVGNGQVKETVIELEDVLFMFSDETIDEICRADLITTSIGFNNMGALVEILVKGLRKRRSEVELCSSLDQDLDDKGVLNILVCEDMPGARDMLAKGLRDASASFAGLNCWLEDNVGVVDSVVDCIVPWRELQDKVEPFEVVTEYYGSWHVSAQDFQDLSGFHIPGIKVTPHLNAYVERHLLTVQAGHAIAAYYGHLRGHQDIRSAMAEEEVRNVVRGAMMETSTIICRRYNFAEPDHRQYIDEVVQRFENTQLRDSVARVGKRPLRKLEPGACLIRPLHFACSLGYGFENLAIGVAACLLYDASEESDCRVIKVWLEREGLIRGIKQLTGLNDERSLRLIASTVTALENQAYERRKSAKKYPSFTESAYSAMVAAHS